MLCIQFLSTIGLKIRLIYRRIFRINAVFFLNMLMVSFSRLLLGFILNKQRMLHSFYEVVITSHAVLY